MALFPPKKGKEEAINGIDSEQIYEDLDGIYETVFPSNPRSHSPSPEYEIPNVQPPSTDKPSDNSNSEEVYEAMIQYLKEKLNPSQMDSIAIMLQSMKNSISEDKTKISGPPPACQPPSPPDVSETIYEYPDHASVVENASHKATNQPTPVKRKPPPVAQKPRRFREFNPSRNPDDLQEFRK